MTTAKLPYGFWTVRENVLEDSKKYRFPAEWSKASPSAYNAAKKHGWYKEATAHMKSPKAAMGHWNHERLVEDARNYNSPSEWKAANASAYASALQKGFLNDCISHMERIRKPDGYWTKALCLKSAAGYTTIIAWSLTEGAAYDASKRNGWYRDCTKHMVKTYSLGEYTLYRLFLEYDIPFEHQKRFDDLKDKRHLPYDFYLPSFNLAIEYQGRQHFETSKSSMYKKQLVAMQKRDTKKREFASERGLNYLALDTPKPAEIEVQVLSTVRAIATAEGRDFLNKRRVITEEELKTLANLGIWTKAVVLEDARKFENIRDWRKSPTGHAHNIALKNGWLEEAKAHMTALQKPKGYWTKERLGQDAREYSRKIDWLKGNRSAYMSANAKGWLKELTAHMKVKLTK